MSIAPQRLTSTFNRFFESEKATGIFLILCTVVSIALSNSAYSPYWAKAYRRRSRCSWSRS